MRSQQLSISRDVQAGRAAAPGAGARSVGERLRRLGETPLITVTLYLLAIITTAVLWSRYWVNHEFAIDFQYTFRIAGSRILHGGNPYSWTPAQIAGHAGFSYPPFAAFLVAPLALLSEPSGAAMFTAINLAAVPATLRLLDVRDRRLYAFAFLLWPVISAWQAGNVSLILALAAAAMWRWRNRPIVAAIALALAVSLKQLVWPLWIWAIATRRYRTAGYAVALGVVINIVAFALLRKGGLESLIQVSGAITTAQIHDGYGLSALVLRLGLPRWSGTGLTVTTAGLIVFMCIREGRRGNEQGAMALAIVCAIAASPLVWNHYFAMLIVPLAIARPRLSWEWLFALLFWFCPALNVTEWQSVLALTVTAVLAVNLTREPNVFRCVGSLPPTANMAGED